jgi:hypothetical protein
LSTGSVISSTLPWMMVMRSLKPLAATISCACSAIVEQSTPITSLRGVGVCVSGVGDGLLAWMVVAGVVHTIVVQCESKGNAEESGGETQTRTQAHTQERGGRQETSMPRNALGPGLGGKHGEDAGAAAHVQHDLALE